MADAKLHVIEAMCKNHNTVDGNSYNKVMVDAKSYRSLRPRIKMTLLIVGIRYNKSIANINVTRTRNHV